MKVKYQLQGKFQRIQLSGGESQPLSLVELVREVQAIATQYHRRTPPILRQSFALDFIPEPILLDLLQKKNGELYQLPSLQLLHPVKSHLSEGIVNTYCYQFICSEASLDLTPDDPQIPRWEAGKLEQLGSYTITLNSPHYPGLSSANAAQIWQQAKTQWENLAHQDKINLALRAIDPNLLCLRTSDLEIWLKLQELALDLREAIAFLRSESNDISLLSAKAKTLVEQYREAHKPPPKTYLIPELKHNDNLTPTENAVIGMGNTRECITKIIAQARQFLLISSYIIEDQKLTALICQKSRELPYGVWILTDLRDKISDRLDSQVNQFTSLPEQYRHCDGRKKDCLRMLLNANVTIRSGAFHLKTYISERSAYLGSGNLTGGSLDVNLEAGIITQNTALHRQLIQSFTQFWQHRSRDEVIPAPNWDGYCLRLVFSSQHQHNYPNLLTPCQYHKDLKKELIQLKEQIKGEIIIYSRSFHPSPEIASILRLLSPRIFVNAQNFFPHSALNISEIKHLHAKITILGTQIAYVGGINFKFTQDYHSVTDLMYKITNSTTINQIRKRLTELTN